MQPWQRQRHPDDVPTPVAVAVADFCRRAGVRPPPKLVREALAFVADAHDLKLRELAEGEPAYSPLGPFAVVDVLKGTSAREASARERAGYYEEVRRTAVDAPPRPVATPPPPPRRSAPKPPEPSAPKRAKKAQPETLEERVAPKKKDKNATPAPSLPASPASNFRPKRDLPPPRGRFALVATPLEKAEKLTAPAGKERLAVLVPQVEHRVALRRLLSREVASKGSDRLEQADVDRALSKHGFEAGLAKRERELVLGGLMEHRGAIGRTAQSVGLDRRELESLVTHLKLAREVKEIRDRFAREALSNTAVGLRLSLLGRRRYLDDLGIAQKFDDALRRDLEPMLKDAALDTSSRDAAIALAARRQAIDETLLSRAVDELSLEAALERPEP